MEPGTLHCCKLMTTAQAQGSYGADSRSSSCHQRFLIPGWILTKGVDNRVARTTLRSASSISAHNISTWTFAFGCWFCSSAYACSRLFLLQQIFIPSLVARCTLSFTRAAVGSSKSASGKRLTDANVAFRCVASSSIAKTSPSLQARSSPCHEEPPFIAWPAGGP